MDSPPLAASYTNAYALIIGAGEDLPASVRDAESVCRSLIDPQVAAFDPAKVTLLRESEAGKARVLACLDDLARASSRDPDSLVIVYYSGHGGRYDREGNADYYLLLPGYDEYRMEETMLSGRELSERLDVIRAGKMLVLLDCCHADGMESVAAPRGASAKAGESSSGSALIDSLNGGSGRIFLASCRDDQKSLIVRGAENSLFTQVLLGAMRGFYSMGEPYVHVLDALTGIIKKVPAEARAIGRVQDPVLSSAFDVDPYFYLCANRGPLRQPPEHANDTDLTPFGELFASETPQRMEFREKLALLKNYKAGSVQQTDVQINASGDTAGDTKIFGTVRVGGNANFS